MELTPIRVCIICAMLKSLISFLRLFSNRFIAHCVGSYSGFLKENLNDEISCEMDKQNNVLNYQRIK